MMEDIENDDHQKAKTIDGREILISEAESGRNGYYCIYCGHEMVAKKGKLELRKHHFAHDSKQKLYEGKCIYSNETYRHKIAKEILQELGQIRVPMVVKYPSSDVEGPPYLLLPARTIKAHSIGIEVPFYEDENGIIRNGREVDLSAGTGPTERNLLVQPDVTFFDAGRKPILFIELVATHKPDVDKLLKIRKLGIDTVQVCIPKDKEEAIRNTFSRVDNTKWVFNYEQEKTEYVRPAVANTAGIPSLDPFQATLLEGIETIDCKTFAVNEFIRRIRKILASSEFRAFEEGIIEEIRHVENSTARAQNEWAELQDRIHREIREGLADEESRLGREEEEIRREEELIKSDEEEFRRSESAFAAEVTGYETRYSNKRASLEQAQREYRPSCFGEIERAKRDLEKLGASPRSYSERAESIRSQEEYLEQSHTRQVGELDDETDREARDIAALIHKREGLPGKYRQIEEGVRSGFADRGREIRANIEDRRARAQEDFERDRRTATEEVERGGFNGVSRSTRRIGELLQIRSRCQAISEGKANLQRLRKLRELYEKGAYKSWT